MLAPTAAVAPLEVPLNKPSPAGLWGFALLSGVGERLPLIRQPRSGLPLCCSQSSAAAAFSDGESASILIN